MHRFVLFVCVCVCYNNTLFAKVIIHSLFPRVLFSFVFPKKGKKKCRHKTPLVLRYSARQRPNKQTVSSPRVRLTHVFFPLRPPSQSSPHGERRDAARHFSLPRWRQGSPFIIQNAFALPRALDDDDDTTNTRSLFLSLFQIQPPRRKKKSKSVVVSCVFFQDEDDEKSEVVLLGVVECSTPPTKRTLWRILQRREEEEEEEEGDDDGCYQFYQQ